MPFSLSEVTWLAPLSVVVLVLLLGWWSVFRSYQGVQSKKLFYNEFWNHLNSFLTSDGFNAQDFEWLMKHVVRLQREMGPFGVAHHHHPPFSQYAYSNYEILVNELPELRRAKMGKYSSSYNVETFAMVREALLRYEGGLEEESKACQKDIYNPFVWWREGIQTTILVPWQILYWFGILSSSTVAKVRIHGFFRIFSGIVAVLTFVATVMTIVLGWNDFLQYLHNLYSTIART